MKNPDDESVKKRLVELTDGLEGPLNEPVPTAAKRDRLLGILESWLTKLEEMDRVS